jgi:hypothetical protein
MTSPQTSPRRYVTPRDIAADLGCNLGKVLLWIKSGELRAINIAVRADSRKPRWRIAALDLEAFLLRRTAKLAPPSAPRRRRADPGVIEFF